MKNEAIELLCRYIRLDTSNPPGNEYLATEFFERIFHDEGIQYKTYESKPGRVSIRAEIKGSSQKKPIILLHHMDVIAANKDEWSFDPFGGKLIDGYICGRGALDTKCLGIIQLQALLDLKRNGIRPNCDLIFLATADEESGGDCGVEYLLREYPDEFQADLVLNEGSYVVSGIIPDRLVAMVSPGEKGPCWLKLTRKGVSGHGSTPHDQNALERMTLAVNRLLNYKSPPRVTPIVAEYFKQIAQGMALFKPYADDGKEETLLKLLKDTGMLSTSQINALLRNTISLNMLRSGDRVNVIPSYAEALVDTRLLPGESTREWLKLVKELLADDKIQIDPVTLGEGNVSDTNTKSYHTIQNTLHDHYPNAITTPYLMLGTTDSRFFRERGILSYGFCPTVVPIEHISSVHGIDEKISAESLLKGAEVYTDIVKRLCA